MKKRTMAVGGLLLAVAMTSYSVAGTYAKYTSKIDLADEARIAKWDLVAAGNCQGPNEFGGYTCERVTELDLLSCSYSLVKDGNNKGIYVQSIDGDKVLAPGTKGEYGVRFGNVMEVRHNFNITFDADEEFAVYYKVDGDKLLISQMELDGYEKYSPITYTLHLFGQGADFTANGTLDEIKTQLKGWETNASNDFAPGRLGMALDIAWKWDTTNVVDGLTPDQVDMLDTYIGENFSEWEADRSGLTGSAKYTLCVSATQIAEDYSTKTN